MKKMIAIDGNSLMFRAYYAIQTAMTSRDGMPTNALHGFIAMLVKLIETNPDYMLVAFDIKGETFRHDTYSEYKAGRREPPEDLLPQFPVLKEILDAMGIARTELFRYEADDLLGTFSRIAAKEDINTVIVTGDRDALQLITPQTSVMLTKKGISETVVYDEEALMRDYGLTPNRMIDLKALMGDASDNIPGIKGVGEKTAKNLLEKYGSLDEILANAQNEKGALQKKLIEGAETARMSYQLGTICVEAPVEMELDACAFNLKKVAGGIPLLAKYGLRANIARLKALADDGTGIDAEPVAESVEETVDYGTPTPIRDAEGLSDAVARLGKASEIAIDISNSLSALSDKGDHFEFITGGNLLEQGLSPDEVYFALEKTFADASIKKIAFDGKKLMNLLGTYEIKLEGLAFDISVADYLLNALNPAKTLAALIESLCISETGAAAVMHISRILNAKLTEKGMSELYYGVELPLVSVLSDMERTGFAVDSSVLMGLRDDMGKRIEGLMHKAYELAGHEFNILSTKQLATVLFDELGLPPQKKTKTGYSTDSDVLEALAGMDPIIEVITEYRFLTKLKSTFIDAMLDKVGSDGRIHTTLNQNVTATGRISSTEPNLQNIPVRTEQGREIRRAFVASPGNTLVGADYSQIELRVLAHLSNDDALCGAFTSGDDIHTRTASEVFGVSQDEVTREMRSAAKAVNFGIVYGISEFGLASQLGIPRYKAGEYIKRYLARCIGVANYMHSSVESGKKNGFSVTLSGRRRDLPELKSGNRNTRAFGERVAMNMPVQGSAADIIKLAMVRVYEGLKKGGYAAKLVLQIHDELIIDCPESEVERVSKLLHDCMTAESVGTDSQITAEIAKRLKLNVPLIADVACGNSWFDTK